MSRRSRRRRRDDPPTSLATLIGPPLSHRSPVLSTLGEWEDRRAYDPTSPTRNYTTFRSRSSAEIVATKPTPVRKVFRPAFRTPQDVVVCVRRHQRKEILHALGRTGRGARRARPRRTATSHISCRRK